MCGTAFAPAYGDFRSRYCSDDCSLRASRIQRSGTTNRRRAKKYGAAWQHVNPLKVLERDGWRCYLCGCETPKALRGTQEPNAPELEHVVPLSKGGAHSYENTRCACRRCNLVKSDRTPEATT